MSVNWKYYLGLLSAWIGSGKTWQEASTLAIQCLDALGSVDLTQPTGALVLQILTGLISSNLHQPAVTGADGTAHAAGPVTNAKQAVALALQFATEHMAASGAPSQPEPAAAAPVPVQPVPAAPIVVPVVDPVPSVVTPPPVPSA
jgi:hypothetical protein